MTGLSALWIPILVSSVIVFLASWVIHMLPLWHKNDFPKVPDEDGVMNALRPFKIPPGEYMVPRCSNPKEMSSPAFIEKMKKGPVLIMTVLPNGPGNMGKTLVQWFLYCVFVGVLSAYVAGRALPAGTPYLEVFRFAGTTAFIAYSVALWQASIWYARPWSATLKTTFDGLIYGLLTAGTFGWLWPK